MLTSLKTKFAPIIRYFGADSEEVRARNTIAGIVIGNIPFYPLYVAWFVGARAWPALLAMLSLPLFALVPAANRISGRSGRWTLLLAGIVDTGLCVQGLGQGSGVELFYVPTALLPLVLYREETFGWRAAMTAAAIAVFLLGRGLGGAMASYTQTELTGLTRMNGVSVTLLSLVILALRWRFSRPTRSATPTV